VFLSDVRVKLANTYHVHDWVLIFVQIQEIQADPGSALAEYINCINLCYPEEIIK